MRACVRVCVYAHLRIVLVVVLLRTNPSPHQLVAHGVSRGLVEVVGGGDVAVLDDGLVQVAVERRLDSCHVFQLRNVAHGDLLLAVGGALRVSHG